MGQHRWAFSYMTAALGLFGMVCLVLFIKASYYAGYETRRGDLAYQQSNLNQAIIHYERAIKWYTPVSHSVRHAVERLWEIGNKAEKRNESALALEAYRSLRGSLYAIEGFNRPYQKWIVKAEGKIASLMATMASTSPQLEPQAVEEKRGRFATLLRRKETLDKGGVLLTEIGFLGWIGTTIGFIWYAFGDNGQWVLRRCLLWGCGIAIFFTGWIIGMLIT